MIKTKIKTSRIKHMYSASSAIIYTRSIYISQEEIVMYYINLWIKGEHIWGVLFLLEINGGCLFALWLVNYSFGCMNGAYIGDFWFLGLEC